MLEYVRGIKVNVKEVEEGYHILENCIQANVNANKIMKVIYNFIDIHKEDKLFLFLEVPSTLDEEKIINDDKQNFHKNIYYLDGLSSKEIKELLHRYESILLNDGLSSFGVGSNYTHDEVGKYKYNVVELYTDINKIDKYRIVFEKEKIIEKESLKTTWDYINKNNPGKCHRFVENDKSIYDVVEKLKEIGLYKANTVAE